MLSLLWCQVLWWGWSKDHECALSWDGRPDEGSMRSLQRCISPVDSTTLTA